MRTDIQALRAFAVTAVVLNHLWPERLGGGYIGVDVFFVVSGFLITGHLLGEIRRTGRLTFGRFYARRARRLLPAATLVLVVSGIATVLVLPFPEWIRTGREILASAFYAQNWLLAAESVDYSALNQSATVAQHYWSLSVEEQFYLGWPLLLLLAWRLGRRHPYRSLVLTVAAVGLISFALSVWSIAEQGPASYFVTYGRLWEFAVGAGVAVLVDRGVLHRGLTSSLGRLLRVLLVPLAALVLVGTAVVYGHDTPFPGWAALLPVLATGAVIAAGTGLERAWYEPLVAAPPVQWLGRISYSLYLWHWPLIVLAPSALGVERSLTLQLGIGVVSLVLADLTQRFVEDVLRNRRTWVASSRRSLLAGVSLMAIVGVLAGSMIAVADQRNEALRPPQLATIEACLGPNALAPGANCPGDIDRPVTAVVGANAEYFWSPDECGDLTRELRSGDNLTTRVCDFSGGDPAAPRVWLVGDSHAQQWQGLVLDLARVNRWKVTLSLLGGCPVIDRGYIGFRTAAAPEDRDACRAWGAAVVDRVERERPDLVFTSSAARLQLIDDGTNRPMTEQFTDALTRVWARWADAGITVVPLIDPPLNGEVRDPACLDLNAEDPRACAVPLDRAMPPDPQALAAGNLAGRVTPVDLTPYFCPDGLCRAAIGGLRVYYDADHLSLQYVRQFRDIVGPIVTL